MAGVGTSYLTIADIVKQMGADGKIESAIVELLSETNEILADAAMQECNDGTSHKSVIRTGLPTATWRKLYGYTQPTKSTNAQVTDATGILETYSVADKDLVEMSKNPAQVRLNEARAHLEAINQSWMNNIFYGNKADDASEFDGLAVRYGTIATSATNIGSNIIDAGGSGEDNTSIWLVTWGENHTSLLYPQGSKAGIVHNDDGIQTETDSNGGKRKVYQSQFQVKTGLTIKDWRATGRIANLDASDLAAGSITIEDYLLQLYYKIRKYAKSGRSVIYANSETLFALHKRAKDKSNVNLSIGEYAGEEIVKFLGKIPIREAEQILNTESVVS